MSSIMSNAASVVALSTLRNIETTLDATHSRISSGLRVSTAEEDAAYWSIATTMRSDDKSLSAVEDALALGAATVDTAYAGMDYAVDVMSEIKSKLLMAREPGVDRQKIDKELTQLKKQLSSIGESASFSGQNWLQVGDDSKQTASIVASFSRGADGSVTVETLDYDLWPAAVGPRALIDASTSGTTGARGILTSTEFAIAAGAGQNYAIIVNQSNASTATEIKLTSTTTDTEVEDMLKTVDAMMERMIDATADLGAISARVGLQSEFVIDLRDTLTRGVGLLVDADMNEESMRLKALETQRKLAIYTLPIANDNARNILSLFQ
ncbi:flagellin N-terminal helical domain-containing protein [Pararhizobium sp.]|uniref:flagellin N-terminal helical domain-containing protein n=1 Tax=Pararhizobium sp. TaxID=1977563 RepID=UPI0027277332|nr:flagellin [Pararhizobium sp.]MDO9417512.1 flagellin [Pararhizobium sp.]